MAEEQTYSFDVASASHDMLRAGRPYIWSRVTLLAASDDDAHLARCCFCHDGHRNDDRRGSVEALISG